MPVSPVVMAEIDPGRSEVNSQNSQRNEAAHESIIPCGWIHALSRNVGFIGYTLAIGSPADHHCRDQNAIHHQYRLEKLARLHVYNSKPDVVAAGYGDHNSVQAEQEQKQRCDTAAEVFCSRQIVCCLKHLLSTQREPLHSALRRE